VRKRLGYLTRTPGGIYQFFPSLNTITSTDETLGGLVLRPYESRKPSCIQAVRYGSCSIFSIGKRVSGSGNASLSSFLNLPRIAGLHNRWKEITKRHHAVVLVPAETTFYPSCTSRLALFSVAGTSP